MAKAASKVTKFHKKISLSRRVLGDKVYDKLHPLGTATEQAAAKEAAAKKAAKDAEADAALMRDRQFAEMADLNDEENRRIKKMLMGAFGTRMYKGSPLTRAAASNTRGGPLALAAAGRAGVAPATPILRTAGTRGGMAQGYRGVIQ